VGLSRRLEFDIFNFHINMLTASIMGYIFDRTRAGSILAMRALPSYKALADGSRSLIKRPRLNSNKGGEKQGDPEQRLLSEE